MKELNFEIDLNETLKEIQNCYS